MKCQSEYGTEADALMGQADECIEEWWEDEAKRPQEPPQKVLVEDDYDPDVKRELSKRGLVENNEETGS